MKNNVRIQNFHTNNYINTTLTAVCVFIIIKYISKYISEKSLISKLMIFICSISFEIYLIHPLVLIYYQKNIEKYLTKFLSISHKISLRFLFNWMLVLLISVFMAYFINLITK